MSTLVTATGNRPYRRTNYHDPRQLHIETGRLELPSEHAQNRGARNFFSIQRRDQHAADIAARELLHLCSRTVRELDVERRVIVDAE